MNFRLYDTASRSTIDFVPGDPGNISFYTCGPTVYDDSHIGNFRAFLAADLLRRWLESPLCTLSDGKGGSNPGPRRVTHVINLTDVGHMTDDDQADGGGEDKMVAAEKRILEAKKSGRLPADADVDPSDPFAIAEFYAARFKEDAVALGLKVAIEAEKDPSLMPRATDHVPGMKRVIAELMDRGFAYTGGQPGSRAIYFDVQRADAYGKLSGNSLEHLRGGAGGRVDDTTQQEKRHPADFLLWKEDTSHKMKWPAPEHGDCAGWGEGYPGWHIECTAMSLARLVPGGLQAAMHRHGEIDLHSGGEDNIFPHHECEIAQSCAFTGAPRFARHWFHPRFLMVDGAKMSKSKGTFHTPRELMAKGSDPAAIRLELIKTHYRANADFSMQGLKDSGRTVERWRQFRATAGSGAEGKASADVRDGVAAALADDLNIAGAIGVINKWINSTSQPSQSDARLLDVFDAILGVLSLEPAESKDTGIAVYLPGAEPSDDVESLLAERRDAKKAKDFARSDAIRDQLAGMGYAVKDIAGGRVEVGPA
ncbi:MAG: cysteine--tRNA ligase [Planctomycetota bacterium]